MASASDTESRPADLREQALAALLNSAAGDPRRLLAMHPSADRLRNLLAAAPASLTRVIAAELGTLRGSAANIVRADVPCRGALEYYLARRQIAARPEPRPAVTATLPTVPRTAPKGNAS